jgi:hypothetical protein
VDVIHDGGSEPARAANLSMGGLALESLSRVEADDVLTLRMHLDEEILTVEGVVVWKGQVHGEGARCGVAFDNLSPEQMGTLQTFIDQWIKAGRTAENA